VSSSQVTLWFGRARAGARVRPNHGKSVAVGYPADANELAQKLVTPTSHNLGSSFATLGAGILKLVHLAIASQLLLGGCASLPQPCPLPGRPMISAELFFGRGIGGRTVSEKEFATFLAAEITPRFPDELTVLGAQGQWRKSRSRLDSA